MPDGSFEGARPSDRGHYGSRSVRVSVCEAGRELAVELARNDQFGVNAPTQVSAESRGIGALLTVRLVPG